MSAQAPAAPVTVVHDFAFVLAGAERVSQAIANEVAPGSPLVTLSGLPSVLHEMRISGGWRSLLPTHLVPERLYRSLAPLYPLLLRRTPPIEGDVVCSSYAFSHHVRCTGRKVVYCHTPMRQIWSGREGYLAHARGWRRLLMKSLMGSMQRADLQAVRTADTYIAASGAVRERIASIYGRTDVSVIAPPLDTTVFTPSTVARPRSYFLWVGRVVEPYKRLGLTIEAFRDLDLDLVVAGDGRDRRRLEQTAPPNVRFLGWQDDNQLADLYRGAVAVVFPSEDDFGLVPVESMACGTPSVAFERGGAMETVTDRQTGIFFAEQTVPSLRAALVAAAEFPWDYDGIAAQGQQYGMDRFVRAMRGVLSERAALTV